MDSLDKGHDLTGAAIVRIAQAIGFMDEIDDSAFDVNTAYNILKTLKLEGKTFEERLGPLQIKAINLLLAHRTKCRKLWNL